MTTERSRKHWATAGKFSDSRGRGPATELVKYPNSSYFTPMLLC